jgi:hypothetical protein
MNTRYSRHTRLLINDACVKLRKPWVYGGAIGAEKLAHVGRATAVHEQNIVFETGKFRLVGE